MYAIRSYYVFGVGSLGTALLHDHGLKQFGLKVIAAFDVNPEVVGKTIEGVPIYHIDEFKNKNRTGAIIGILTVPVGNSQEVTSIMVEGGIKAIWNFTLV